MNAPWLNRASFLLLLASLGFRVDAVVVNGAVTGGAAHQRGGVFQKLTPPLPDGNTVGNDNFQHYNLFAFDEQQNFVVGPEPLAVDIAADGNAGNLPPGTLVASHYVFYDPPPPGGRQVGYVEFNANIVGVIASRARMLASDEQARVGSVIYLSPQKRGLENPDRVAIHPTNPRRLDVDLRAGKPGDYLRVLTGEAAPAPQEFSIGGSASPWLAGMPYGTVLSGQDASPGQAAVEILHISLRPGTFLRFACSGSVATAPGIAAPQVGPEGEPAAIAARIGGSANGISDCRAPLGSLVGVFLGLPLPSAETAPPTLDFSTPEAREFTHLAPRLRQVFYIGSGTNASGAPRSILVPPGATRLFLGVMAPSTWSGPGGSFTARALSAPGPGLTATRQGPDGLLLCWEGVRGLGQELQMSADPADGGSWTPVAFDGEGDGDRRCAVIPLAGPGFAYFRLKYGSGAEE